jgi:hypothetical protein
MDDLCQGDQGPSRDRAAIRRASRIAVSAAMLAPLVACHTSSPRVTAPDRTPPAPAAPETADGSYDWHVLLIAPFGSVLKDIPAGLHEVLLFRDEAHGGAAADTASAADAECYATDAPAPRFVGRISEEYLLCLRQDRLSRIRASVRLTAAEAPQVFAAACAGWLQKAAPSTPGAESPPAEARSAGGCEGRDGAIFFSGRLEQEPGQTDLPQPESVLSIILDGAPNP